MFLFSYFLAYCLVLQISFCAGRIKCFIQSMILMDLLVAASQRGVRRWQQVWFWEEEIAVITEE